MQNQQTVSKHTPSLARNHINQMRQFECDYVYLRS